MGTNKREAPQHLAKKLLALRKKLGVSQRKMYALLHPDQVEFAPRRAAMIYSYERGLRVPSLLELQSYVAVVRERFGYRISIDDLVDDRINLWV